MPRVTDQGRAGGVLAPGVYRRLLEVEREVFVRRAGVDREGPPLHRRSRRLLEALEAGKPVVTAKWHAENRRAEPPIIFPRWRDAWGGVLQVEVHPDDVVRPIRARIGWPGLALEDLAPQDRD